MNVACTSYCFDSSAPASSLTCLLRGVFLRLILGGAAGVLAGALSLWAAFQVFHNIEINLPGTVLGWAR